MCILPNFEPRDLEAFKRKRKSGVKKAEAETVKLIVAEHPLETKV